MSKEAIEMLEELETDLVNKLRTVREQIKKNKMQAKKLDFEGKYIRYDGDIPIYMRVDLIREEPRWLDRFDYSYTLRGFGFSGEFTGYDDATSFYWDYMYEFDIYGDERSFNDKVNKIQIISEEVFEEAFNICMESVKEYNEKRMNHYKNIK